MKWFLLFVGLAFATPAQAACVFGLGTCAPGIEEAEPYLRKRVDVNSRGLMTLMSLTKTDGRSIGSPADTYELSYNARVEFVGDAWWSPNSSKKFFTLNPNDPLANSGASRSGRIGRKGEQATIPGTIAFRKYESGWRVIASEAYEGGGF